MAPESELRERQSLDAAVALFHRLRNESSGQPPRRLALQAVDAVYGKKPTKQASGSSEAAALTPSRRAELAATVLRRAGIAGSGSPGDRVERASEHSFPSSDPPGWIWGPPDPPSR